MKLRLLSFGKLKNPAFKDLAQDYGGRIKKSCSLSIEEIKEEAYKPKQSTQALQKESDRLLKKISPQTYLILLDEKGRAMTSRDWAAQLSRYQDKGISELAWVIGSAYGVSDSLRKRAQESWSLSNLTLPHEMARVFFLEQLYRAISINQGLPYHHD